MGCRIVNRRTRGVTVMGEPSVFEGFMRAWQVVGYILAGALIALLVAQFVHRK